MGWTGTPKSSGGQASPGTGCPIGAEMSALGPTGPALSDVSSLCSNDTQAGLRKKQIASAGTYVPGQAALGPCPPKAFMEDAGWSPRGQLHVACHLQTVSEKHKQDEGSLGQTKSETLVSGVNQPSEDKSNATKVHRREAHTGGSLQMSTHCNNDPHFSFLKF